MTSPSTSGLLASTADSVDAIRRAILTGDFAPGQRLVEAELSERFEISRGVARSALVDLAHEGLVERVANRGARVRAVSVQEAIEITEVRMAVEGLCAAKAAEHITDEEIVELRALGEEMKAAVASADFVTYSKVFDGVLVAKGNPKKITGINTSMCGAAAAENTGYVEVPLIQANMSATTSTSASRSVSAWVSS